MHRPEWYAKIAKENVRDNLNLINQRSILQIANDIHSTIAESMHRSLESLNDDVRCVEHVLATWRSNPSPKLEVFDCAVLNLLKVCMLEYNLWKTTK